MNSSLTQRLVRLVFPYGAVRKVIRGPVKGLCYVVEPGMGMTYALGVDSMCIGFLERHIHPRTTVYDIGANRGQMTLFFARAVGASGRVVSYEPVPSLCETMERNIRLNSMANVATKCIALSDRKGVASFEYSESYSTQGQLAGVEPTYRIPGATVQEVRVTTLDSEVDAGLRPPDIVKVDVEGGAAAVFRGAGAVLEKYSPKIYVELHGPEEQAGILKELIARGYVCETLDGVEVMDPTDGWHSPLWCCRR